MFHKVPAYLRCGEVVNNHIKKGLLLNLSDFFKLVNIWQSYKQERAWLSHALCAPGQHTAKRGIRKCTYDFDCVTPVRSTTASNSATEPIRAT